VSFYELQRGRTCLTVTPRAKYFCAAEEKIAVAVKLLSAGSADGYPSAALRTSSVVRRAGGRAYKSFADIAHIVTSFLFLISENISVLHNIVKIQKPLDKTFFVIYNICA
jgi:hypothetical protein